MNRFFARRSAPGSRWLTTGVGILTGASLGVGAVAFARHQASSSASQLFSWGSGQYGQTGLGHERDTPVPKALQYLDRDSIVSLSAGGDSSAAISSDGRVWTWGRGQDLRLGHTGSRNETHARVVQLPPDAHVRSASIGDSHMVFVLDDGRALSCGRSWDGQLGQANSAQFSSSMSEGGPVGVVALPSGTKVTQSACGKRHSVFLTEDGRVFVSGSSKQGQLGLGHRETIHEPQQLDAAVFGGSPVAQVAAGDDFSVFVTRNGDLYACGANDFGQIGCGVSSERYIIAPQKIDSLQGQVRQVAAGAYHALAVTKAGRVYSWGMNKTGQLGHGNNFNMDLPLAVDALGDAKVAMVGAGGFHSGAVTEDGTLFCWGKGRHGQLGRSDPGSSVAWSYQSPLQVTAVDNVEALALGRDHTLALAARVKA